MEKSIYQIIKAFETFATSHKGIASFQCNIIQKNTAKGTNYPMLYTTIGSAAFNNGEIRLQVDAYFLTMTPKDEAYTKSLSDMLRYTEDFYTYFNCNEDLYGFYFSDSVTAEPVAMQYEDGLIGWKLPIVVQVRMRNNENEIPV